MMRLAALTLTAILMALPANAQSWQPRDGDTLAFDVTRDGGEFGTHTVKFTRDGDTLIVKTDIALKVALGPITFFEYAHDVTEHYRDGKLVWVGSRTKNEGKWKTLTAQAAEGGLNVKGDKFKGLLTGVVIPSTHWNRDEMGQPTMFSTETGEMLPMKVKDRGTESVKVGTQTIQAQRFDVDSDIDASFWYDAEGRWVKTYFETQGSKVEYRLRALPV
ncbi:MAG: hypothetical protein EON61_15375 [Alphaproteobacteria bacterium]|nr:MAG: hypothetical protein EON61_15375 [Alphaproteobacteria bacterium]